MSYCPTRDPNQAEGDSSANSTLSISIQGAQKLDDLLRHFIQRTRHCSEPLAATRLFSYDQFSFLSTSTAEFGHLIGVHELGVRLFKL